MMLHVRQTLPWGRRGLTTRQMAGLDSDGSDCTTCWEFGTLPWKATTLCHL
jgi:hypothetical protein